MYPRKARLLCQLGRPIHKDATVDGEAGRGIGNELAEAVRIEVLFTDLETTDPRDRGFCQNVDEWPLRRAAIADEVETEVDCATP